MGSNMKLKNNNESESLIKRHEITIIIPCYNEEITIADTILDFHRNSPHSFIGIINNASTDQTEMIARNTIKKYNIPGIVINETKKGKGYAIRRGFQEIDSEIYVMVDADSTYLGSDLPKMLNLVQNNESDFVVGDRHKSGAYKKENKRKFHQFGNNLVKVIINFLFNSNLNDIMSGYRVMNRKFIKNFPVLSEGFELETELTLHALDKRFRIQEVSIIYRDRPAGSFSKLNTIRDGIKVLKTIIWIFKYYKPFVFFGTLSLLFFFMGLITGVPVLYEFYKTKFILHVPLAILTMGIFIMSLISFSIGLVLDTIVKFHKFDFELRMNNYE
jgi:glycosyltransferase involved in cell wall biosynthesis